MVTPAQLFLTRGTTAPTFFSFFSCTGGRQTRGSTVLVSVLCKTLFQVKYNVSNHHIRTPNKIFFFSMPSNRIS
ncbi:hypothetical protein OIU79_015178 [Salix purpurea]|uniref:Uncharacterized protein n=1 Tax=Salix purpurea TaxID=77065 RepID=A0A9Q0PB64_SALPP|nr:hypothetical protein OIU79_015178 [Salix purpurea]